jgi:hypothetical protein
MEKEIQWVGVKETKELNEYLQKMIQFMMLSNTEVITFFIDLKKEGYMLEAYDDFDWFELTNRKFIFEDDCHCQ